MKNKAFFRAATEGQPCDFQNTCSRSTLAPKGKRESFAILKNCFPHGIPMMVMHRTMPMIALPTAISRPPKMIHRRLSRNETGPASSYTISLPNGSREILASLKHCRPTGMPTTVMHYRQPKKTQPRALISPPKISHRMFNKSLIEKSPLILNLLFWICFAAFWGSRALVYHKTLHFL